ncbi:MAG: site-2 protease family protein [Eubacteriales bacterium]|nr:site-2 protease family protein [Eubacteriales bacterium]
MVGGLLTGKFSLIDIITTLVLFVFSITIHEVAHGFVAYKLGDPTAKNYGRLTLNPRKHLDPLGTILILLVGFGWAKPVPIDSRYFENPKRDKTLVSIAGPLSNLILAFLALLIFSKVCVNLYYSGTIGENVINACSMFFGTMASLNITLAVFNLLPIPPLDGSKIFLAWAPYRFQNIVYSIERFGFIGVYLVIIIISRLGIISGVSGVIWNLMNKLIDILPF